MGARKKYRALEALWAPIEGANEESSGRKQGQWPMPPRRETEDSSLPCPKRHPPPIQRGRITDEPKVRVEYSFLGQREDR